MTLAAPARPLRAPPAAFRALIEHASSRLRHGWHISCRRRQSGAPCGRARRPGRHKLAASGCQAGKLGEDTGRESPASRGDSLGRIAPASGALVALSSSSVFPERMPDAFETAARLGYDGSEVMVTTDLISQDVDVLRRLVDYHGIPVLAVHAPCLLVTQRVWGREPWGKLDRARQAAEQLGARVVVLHPPFRWQREYAREFEARLARIGDETDVLFAVENLYPLRARGAEVAAYAPHWNPVELDCRHVTLDLSHTAVSESDALAMAAELGPRLAHVHMARS